MAQKWYKKAPVQAAIVTGIFLLVWSAITHFSKVPKLENEIEELEKKCVEKTSEIQRLEILLTPFRTIALEKYTGSDQETLRKLANDLGTLQHKIIQLEDRPNFDQNMVEMITGIPVPRKYSSETNYSNNLSARDRFACIFWDLGFEI
jgi:hypothetical protein